MSDRTYLQGGWRNEWGWCSRICWREWEQEESKVEGKMVESEEGWGLKLKEMWNKSLTGAFITDEVLTQNCELIANLSGDFDP